MQLLQNQFHFSVTDPFTHFFSAPELEMSFNNVSFIKEGCCKCTGTSADSSPSTEKSQGHKWQSFLLYVDASGFSTGS